MNPNLRSHRPIRRVVAGLAAVLFLVGAAACGDDDDPDADDASDSTSTTTTEAAPGGDAGASGEGITAQDFSLTSVTVAAGAEVPVTNEGGAPHTVTADDDSFDSGQIAGGETGSVTAPTEPGEYPFHCEIHPAMTGTLTVEG